MNKRDKNVLLKIKSEAELLLELTGGYALRAFLSILDNDRLIF